jgi:hypothetical protein
VITRREPEVHKQAFLNFSKLTRSACRMFRLTKVKVSCNSLSASATCEHASFASPSTHLQSIGEGGRLGQPDRSKSDNPGPTTPDDPGVGDASPRAVLSETPTRLPHVTKPLSEPSASSPDRGLAPSMLTLVGPGYAPSALSASRASGVGPSGTGISRGTATICGELEETRDKSPMFAAATAAKGRYRGVTRHAAGQWTIRVTKVRLLSLKHSPSTSEHGKEKREWCKPIDNITHIPRGHRHE